MTEIVYSACAGSATPRKRVLTSSSVVSSSLGKSRSAMSSRTALVTPREELKPIVKTNDDLWRKEHEAIVSRRINDLKEVRQKELKKEQKQERTSREELIVALAKDWIRLQNLGLDDRVYVVEKMLPSVVLGVEKLIGEVERRELVPVGPDANFNPINFLAQYLMRNNPKYTNLFETSAYTQAVHETMTSIKAELYETHDTRLARLKAEGRRRMEAKAERDKLKLIERERRLLLIKNLLLDWTRVGLYSLAQQTFSTVVQNFMRPFIEKVQQFPPEVRLTLKTFLSLVETFIDKPTFTFTDFNDFLTRCTYDMPSDVFDAFIVHLRQAAVQYRIAVEREERRIVLEKLFVELDSAGVGQLDRQRVLMVFEKFYAQLASELRSLFRDPRRWPVVDASEENDEDDDDELTEDGVVAEEEVPHESPAAAESYEQTAEVLSEQAHDPPEIHEPAQGDLAESAEAPAAAAVAHEAAAENEASAERHEVSFNPQVEEYEIEPQAQAPLEVLVESRAEALSARVEQELVVSEPQQFAEAELVEGEREKTFASLVASLSGPATANGSRSVATSFDSKYLNVAQFAQTTENFIGPEPSVALFRQLLGYMRLYYQETEEEKHERLLEQQRQAQLIKRKWNVDSLFEKWDNDGAGFLNFVDVEKVCIAFRSGAEAEAIAKAKKEVRGKAKSGELRLTKRDFRKYIFACAKNIGGEEHVDALVDYCKQILERAYAEKVRGETRKKWLHRIIAAAETSGASLEPVYKTVFQILLRDADLHANGKVIAANMALLEKNRREPERGEMMLKYVAATNDDAPVLLGNALFSGDQVGVSFQVVESGKVLHVPRINLYQNIKFWEPRRESSDDRAGALLIVPLKDVHNRVFGTLTADTMRDSLRSMFQTHEVHFYQGVARAFSIAFHYVMLRKQLIAMTQSALLWVYARVGFVVDITLYLVEPTDQKSLDFALRRVLMMKADGHMQHFEKPDRVFRKDSLFRDYLFSCIDTSEAVESDAYGLHHMAYPIRDLKHVSVAVLDISVEKSNSHLSPKDKRPIVKVLSILQQAYGELAREFGTERGELDIPSLMRKTPEPRVEQRDLQGAEMFFNQLLLQQVRSKVEKLGGKAYAELRSYKEPPSLVVAIVKSLVALFYPTEITSEEYMTWSRLKVYVSLDLGRKILEFDPMNPTFQVDVRSVMQYIVGIPRSEVAQHSSIPADALYNWVYIAMTLYEHTQKLAPPPPQRSPAEAEQLHADAAPQAAQPESAAENVQNAVEQHETA